MDKYLLADEEISYIIRTHHESRVKPSRTEIALIKAQLDKVQPRIQELEAQVKRLQIMLDVAHQDCSEMEVKLNKYKEREQSMIALWGEK